MTNALQSVAQRLAAAQAEVVLIEENEIPALLKEHGAVGAVLVGTNGEIQCLGNASPAIADEVVGAANSFSSSNEANAALALKRLIDAGHTVKGVGDQATYTVR